MPQPGFVTLVGAGPGDPGLVTVAGLRALETADVVVYDALAAPELLDACRPDAERIDAGKRAGAHAMPQEATNALLVAKAREGKRVVRLKGGDPFVFGRGGEEALALRAAGVPFAVIPGVTSAIAVPVYAGIPVTQRGMARSFAVISGAESTIDSHDWDALARIDTLVVLMGAAALGDLCAKLIAAGRSPATPAAAIAHGTLPTQASVLADLATLPGAVRGAALPTPLLTVIGDVAAMTDTLAWRTALSLAGRSVVITRTRVQASQLRAALSNLGARVVEVPVLDIRFPAVALPEAPEAGVRWEWVVFASQNGVAGLTRAVREAGHDSRWFAGAKLAAVGPATAAALEANGLRADFVPATADAEHLAAELPLAAGERVLLACGSLSGDGLEAALAARGAAVDRLTVYETAPAPLDEARLAALRSADAVTFASASAARFLAQALGERSLPEATKLCAIGPQAANATREAFGRVDAIAAEPSVEALAAAVLEALT